MTKEEVRAVAISKLEIYQHMQLLDIGAGTGSISIESAQKGAYVISVEQKQEAIDLLYQNREKFNIQSMEIIEGQAPNILKIHETMNNKNRMFDRIFIGGNGGQIEAIFDYIDNHLVEGGIVVANTIAIESTSKILALLKKHRYLEIEVVNIAVQRNKAVGNLNMMLAENSVTILKGIKNGK